MRWCAALAIVLCALLVVAARVGRVAGGSHRLRRPAATPVEDSRAEVPAPATPPPPPSRPETPPRPISRAPLAGQRERRSVAHVHGRVLLSSGGGDIDDLDDLQVDADDGLRLVHARLSAGGRFSFHLPPGRYTLVAESGDLAGTTLGVLAGADQEQEIDIRLGPAATVRGTLRGPAGAEITLRALPVGSLHPARSQSVEDDGKFALPGLIPGRRYDLTFFGPAIRETTLRSIVAPVDRLEVVVAALPIVRGAIGFPPGETCPIETVSLHRDGIAAGDDQAETEVDADCHFELTPPEGASLLTVVAEGAGWRLEESLAIPAQGDPEPICFNPPCRTDASAP